MQQTPKLEMKSFSKNYRRFFRENRLQWSDNKNVKKSNPKYVHHNWWCQYMSYATKLILADLILFP